MTIIISHLTLYIMDTEQLKPTPYLGQAGHAWFLRIFGIKVQKKLDFLKTVN